MGKPTVTIRFEEDSGKWRIYWSGTNELADEELYDTLDDAGPAARALMGYTEPESRRPMLERIG
jgi:hypothetical protein